METHKEKSADFLLSFLQTFKIAKAISHCHQNKPYSLKKKKKSI